MRANIVRTPTGARRNMATILEVRDEYGEIKRRCDATCHDAKHDKCDCICGGAYHGIGSEAALAISYEALNEMRAKLGLDGEQHVQLRIGA